MPPFTASELISEAKSCLDSSTRSGTFNRAESDKIDKLLRMAELTRRDPWISDPGPLTRQYFQRRMEQILDPATIAFFGGQAFRDNVVSERGMQIDVKRSSGSTLNGRMIGKIAELRDYSLESRTYSGLTTSTSGDAAGFTVPIGYVATVMQAAKRTDQILEAANWDLCATPTGKPLNVPSLTDVSTSAVKIAQLDPQTFANPTFSQISNGSTAFAEATTWTSQVVRASKQLAQDAVPMLAATLADCFRVRIARGFGADVVATVIGDAPVGATTAGATAITQKDLLELVKSVDAQYAMSDRAGWCMNWNTLLYIFENVVTSGTSGDALFHAKRDSSGHFLLMGYPVFVSNSLDDIGAAKKPVVFGDYNRLLIRNVPGEMMVRRYDELFAAKYENGYEMIVRLDSAIMHAGGAGDDPIKVLQCHA